MCKGWRVFDTDPAESFSELFLSHAHKQSRNAGVCSAGGSRFDGLAEVMHWEGMEEAALAFPGCGKPAETHLQGDLGKNLLFVGPWCLGGASSALCDAGRN